MRKSNDNRHCFLMSPREVVSFLSVFLDVHKTGGDFSFNYSVRFIDFKKERKQKTLSLETGPTGKHFFLNLL